MITGLLAAGVFAVPVIGWWIAYDDAKKQRKKAELAAALADGYQESNKALAARLVTAEQQLEWFRSRESHPSFRRVK